MTTYLLKNETSGLIAGIASLCASFVAGLACVGPLAGILMGVSGLGWLSAYSYLTVPASLASVILLAVAFYLFARRKSSCASRRRHMLNRAFLVITAMVVIGINVFEYVIFPNMA